MYASSSLNESMFDDQLVEGMEWEADLFSNYTSGKMRTQQLGFGKIQKDITQ